MKTVHYKSKTHTLYIGRPSPFGNPFIIGKDGGRPEVIAKFEQYARSNPTLMSLIKTIPENSVLGCYCTPHACHGDIIIKLWKEMNI